MQNPLTYICSHLPTTISQAIETAAKRNPIPINEIRLRIGQPLSVVTHGQNLFVTGQGEFTVSPATALPITRTDLTDVFMWACRNSVYAYSKELQNGFITLPGGHRMGIAGKIVYENNTVSSVRDISSLSIRIAGEVKGCSLDLLPYLLWDGQIRSCAVISPPGGGKTTYLRDIARCLSLRGHRVCVIDERGEIAGSNNGISQYDLGPLCDILDGCHKTDGLMWALRCLSPTVMIVDELGSNEEAHAVLQGINGGVATIFSIHASDIRQVISRTPMKILLEHHMPELLVFLGNSHAPGKIVHIHDMSRKEDADLVKNLWHSSA